VTLTRDDVGRRVVVRRVLAGQSGPSGGPAMGDVLGVLEECEEDHLVVRRRDGVAVRVAVADVVAAKTVPPPPPRRR
jgi:N-acetylglutamate synthase